MKKHIIKLLAIYAGLALSVACKKSAEQAELPAGSVSFEKPAGSDVIESEVSILADQLTVLEFKAALTGASASDEHWVTFAVDTSKIADYRSKYPNANALVLPTSTYLFYKPMVRIAAGENLSEAAQLNIGAQTKLTEYSTYVLPIVIRSVDGKTEGAGSSRVIYYVFKTGKPLFVNKTGWTIAGFSSQNAAANAPTFLLDANNTTTYWSTSITQTMPQWVSINLNKDVTFTAVAYYLPTALAYPKNGGYPTSIQIETSMNGTTWVNKGVYAGNVVNNMQTIDIGVTTARYLRFTSLAAAKYSNAYDAVFIAGISLVP